MQQVYNYHPETGDYLGMSLAQESPRELGVFLIPAYATTTAPPEPQPGMACVWDGEGWTQAEDHRGETVYDTATREARQITELGPLPDGVTTLQPATDRDEWDGGQWMTPPPEPKLLTAYEFKERFSPEEQALIMTSPELAPLALHVLTAPNGVDVTDATAQGARAALEAVEDEEGSRLFPDARLDEIFAVPE